MSQPIERKLRDIKPMLDASAELADELDALTHREAADLGARYIALKDAQRITGDGDILEEREYTSETERLRDRLKAFIEKNEPIRIEGKGQLRVSPRGEKWHDLAAMLRDDAEALRYLLEQGWVKVNLKQVEQNQPDLLPLLKKYQHEGAGPPALIIERER